MNNILFPILIATIAGLSTVLGGLVIYLKIGERNITKFITFCLAFSVGIMICISILDLIPESSYIVMARYGILKGILSALGVFVLGAFLVGLLNRKLEGLKTKSSNNNLYKIGILSMLALMLHNFPEGIATFMSAYKDIVLGISLGTAIMLHNIPEGISIAVPIYYATGSKKTAIAHTFLSGLAEPLGAIVAYIFLHKYITSTFIALTLIFVAGIMITLAIHELLPQALKYREEKWLILGLLLGTIVMLVNHCLF